MTRPLRLEFEGALYHGASPDTSPSQTEDHAESVAAFKEKRKPVFKGR